MWFLGHLQGGQNFFNNFFYSSQKEGKNSGEGNVRREIDPTRVNSVKTFR